MNEDGNSTGAGALDGIGDIAGFFAPDWAKEETEETVRVVGGAPRRDDADDRPPRPRGAFPQGRDGDRPRRRPPFPQNREGGRDGAPGRDGFAAPRRPPEKPLALQVRFLPDARALDAIIRRIQTARRAYPFRDIVRLFQKDDASLAVRIEVDRAAEPGERMRQCRVCSLPALTDDELAAHLLERHLGDYFEARDVEGEAPKGNFPCVARCGLTGELLGPPNHHSYAAKIQEMLRERFPNMREAEYRSRIEMVRDAEAIEQWREAARHQTLYFRKPEAAPAPAAPAPAPEAAEAPAPEEAAPQEAAPEAPAAEAAPEPVGVTRAEAEAIFRREIMPGLVGMATHVVCQAKALKNMPNRRLASFLNGAFARDAEMRSQGSLARAIHAAFHHRGLHFFRIGDDHGQEFVSAAVPSALDTSNVTPEIRDIVSYVEANPCCQAKTLVEALAKDGGDEASKRIAASLRWLVEKGHVVAFFNGMLAPGAQHPVFAQRPKQSAPEAPAPEAPAPTPAAPAPEAAPEAPAPDQPAAADEAPVPAPESAEAPAVEAPAAEAPAPEAVAPEAPVADPPAPEAAPEAPAPLP